MTEPLYDSRFAKPFRDPIVEAARTDGSTGQDWVDNWRSTLDATAEFISSAIADRLYELREEAPPLGLYRKSKGATVPLTQLARGPRNGSPYDALKRAFTTTLQSALVEQCAPPTEIRGAGPAYREMNRLLGLLPLFFRHDSWAESHRKRGMYKSVDQYFELRFAAGQFCHSLETTPRTVLRFEPGAKLEEVAAIAKRSPHFLHLLARRGNPPSANGYMMVHRGAQEAPYASYNIDNFALQRDRAGRGAIRVACDLSHLKITPTDQHGRRRSKCPAAIGPNSAVERMWDVLVDIAASQPSLWPSTIELTRAQNAIRPVTHAVRSAESLSL